MAIQGFGINGKSLYENISKVCVVNLQFKVDNTAGAGLTSLKSNGFVSSAFMHSSSPSSDNPNPANGVLQIQLSNAFNKFIGAQMSIDAPVTGAQLAITALAAALTPGQVYIIDALGNSTAADFQAIGLPVGITPAVGMAFVATATGFGTSTGKVKAVGSSGILGMEIMGQPAILTNSNVSQNGGAIILMQLLDATGALAAPAQGSIINVSLKFDGSSVTVDGL